MVGHVGGLRLFEMEVRVSSEDFLQGSVASVIDPGAEGPGGANDQSDCGSPFPGDAPNGTPVDRLRVAEAIDRGFAKIAAQSASAPNAERDEVNKPNKKTQKKKTNVGLQSKFRDNLK